ncbi:phage portal protein [Spongiibacter marinus]|uniref:phage portal protein n=1 Tax=Spongiibacter marinus TaxID=354246 RepID=UPI0019604C5F|nr:phage portal protein [Spongiibacter marinus]MBM7423803.1 PBSX family phage portal protein [Spongiibacter marinus]
MATAKSKPAKKQKTEVFTFGDAEPVLAARDILGYTESWFSGKWYEPPVSVNGLAKTYRANPHHSSAIQVKKNVLVKTFRPHPLLSRQEFEKFVLDDLVFGNAYLERETSRLGTPIRLRHSLSKYTRRGKDDTYWFIHDAGNPHEFLAGSVFHLLQPDINQEIYGVPEYMSSLQSAWLNESATIFRRRYYDNGSHAGFILYMTDASQNGEDVDAIRKAMKESKGPGNFKNLFMYAPNGKKDGMQIIPISEVSAKDEFFNIKNVTRDDLMAGHRVPPQLMGVIPTNTSGLSDPAVAARVFAANEIEPSQERYRQLNDWLGEEVITFNPYTIEGISQV